MSQVGTGGIGKGGNINLEAASLSVTNGAKLASSTFGQGDAGNVFIIVRDIASFDGVTPDGSFSSGAFSTVNLGASGKGGNLELSVGSLAVTNGAELNASTFGQGDAGNVRLTIQGAASFDGTTPNGRFSSGIFSSVNEGITGQGGNVE